MRIEKRLVQRVLIGLLLVAMAGGISLVIKDAIAARTPENAIPEMTVYYNDVETGVRLPAKHVYRDSYSWRFLWWKVEGANNSLMDIDDLEPAWVPGGAPLLLEFSFRNSEIQVSMAKEGEDFKELGGNLSAPRTPGIYTYRVWAGWGLRGSVLYYFKIQVPAS